MGQPPGGSGVQGGVVPPQPRWEPMWKAYGPPNMGRRIPDGQRRRDPGALAGHRCMWTTGPNGS